MRAVDNKARFGWSGQDRRRAKCLAAAIAAVPLCALPTLGTATAAEPELPGPGTVTDAEPELPAPGTVTDAEPRLFDALTPGARVFTLSLLAGGNDDDLGGVVCQDGRTCVPVPYPYLFRSAGVDELDDAIRSDGSPGQQIVYGYSQGARIASDWLDKYGGTAGAPTPDDLTFVLIGNPGRKYGGGHNSWGQTTPATDYSVLDVSRQYDLATDVPDDPSNLLAMANALAGFSQVHTEYEDIDLYDSANYVWTEGNTTYVFVPADRLPILTLLYGLGLTEFADSLDAPLRAAIEKGYDRSYLPAEPGLPPAEAEPEPERLSAEPDQAVAAAVTSPSSRNAIAQDKNDTVNQLADSMDSQAESESVSMDVDAANADLVDVAVVDADVVSVDVVDADADADGMARHRDLEDSALEDSALEDSALEDSALEDSAMDSQVDDDQGAAAAASEESESPQPSRGEAASSSDSETSSSDSDTSSGS